MDTDIQNDPGSIKMDFVRVINDFSQYLSCQKQMGNTVLGISKESENLICNWGNKPGVREQVKQLLLFEGPENASVFIIDSERHFFKGQSGELFVKILNAMNLSPDSVFICNAENIKFVYQKIKTISPKVIITLGTKAGQFLLNTKHPIEQFRGKFHEIDGIKVMPTFHPSLLLKHSEFKRQVWEDMKLVMEYAGLKHDS
ncbi:uracil-DNA glycosylase [Desulfobacula phenolica]|uniref:DNA polymerase n=1 Tax=Desulfobacula phenolica TaxID=90732 RepID=A0A1H2EH95_9BACT|nr:uracil-DNA glycosylase [Desulfobacula phenolica]SDT94506.1 DNA polymerase [Desulfobacula phenolica]